MIVVNTIKKPNNFKNVITQIPTAQQIIPAEKIKNSDENNINLILV